ncbi:hypothetical protein KX928_18410 [Roseobacter sp. YSTF-M11]|uniref:Cytochrome c domain-containing protein n=1 Tax=Roseobacter insulae TaxID=2859783 RepID=A0A9X1FZ88_9RHOB|nr:hypothetical protein [Roseobacter insulae]MBW4709765.1 hypothetical protein [Roseobacter insulae]
MWRPSFCAGVLVLICWGGAAAAQPIDPHALYEEGCAECHAPHAGDFAFDGLELLGNTLVGKTSGRPLSVFLEAGHGHLSPAEIEVMVKFLSDIRQSGRLFLKKCRICHSNAKELARHGLVLHDDKLYGRYTGREIARFLANHGRLEPGEVAIMLNVLKRQMLSAPVPDNRN